MGFLFFFNGRMEKKSSNLLSAPARLFLPTNNKNRLRYSFGLFFCPLSWGGGEAPKRLSLASFRQSPPGFPKGQRHAR